VGVAAVIVVSPEGATVIVSRVIVEGDEGLVVWDDTSDGPRKARIEFESLEDAQRHNNKSTTTAYMSEVDDEETAKAMLGKPPTPEP